MDSPPSSIILDLNKSSPPSPSPSPSPPGKVCIVSTYSTWEKSLNSTSEKSYYAVFIVDFASPKLVDDVDGDCDDLIQRLSPKILLDLNLDSARESDTPCSACVLNSTLYLFQKGRPAIFTPRRYKRVYAYDLSPYLDGKDQAEPVVVHKNMLCPAPEMLSPKNCPTAILTPDGKRILVFSGQFFYDPKDRTTFENEADFEVFHPLLETKRKNKLPWKKLPSLHYYLDSIGVPGTRSATFEILSYGFITKSTFLIHIKFGFFTIDIDMLVPAWKKLCGSHVRDPFYGPLFGIEGDKLWLTTSGACDVSKGYNDMCKPISTPFFSSPFGKDFQYGDPIWSNMHTVYGKHGKLFGIVRSRLGVDERTNYAHMVLDVYNTDLDKYRNDKKKNVGADARLETSLKTFRFIVDRCKCFEFSPLCLIPIPNQGTK